MKVLLIDNYDSFTYNLVHYVENIINKKVLVIKNDDSSKISTIKDYDKIIISPGPGLPSQAGNIREIIGRYCKTKDILGICLGHQAIAEHFGATLENLPEVAHGVSSLIKVTNNSCVLFQGIPSTFNAGRYHSWIVSHQKLPGEIQITALDEKGRIMGIKHSNYKIYGIQFHPESIMTGYGKKIIWNWLMQEYL